MTPAGKRIVDELWLLNAETWQLDAADSVAALALSGERRHAEALARKSYQNLKRKLGPEARAPLAAAARLAAVCSAEGKPAPLGGPSE